MVGRDDYWMALAFVLLANSTSNHSCVIVGENNELLCVGHDKTIQNSNYVVFAEINAIFNCKQSVSGGTAYLTHVPCYNRIIPLIGANIKKIVYFPEKNIDSIKCDFVKSNSEEFKGNLNWIRDYLKTLDIF